MVTLRPVRTAGDARALGRLVVELARYEELDPPTPAALRRLARDAGKRFRAVLAWIDDEPVGYSITFETYSTFQGRPVFYLEDLFVLPERRRAGVGTRLFVEAVRRARAVKACRMEWQVLTWNEPALRFYEKIGARKLDDWVWHRLEEERFLLATKAPVSERSGRSSGGPSRSGRRRRP